MAEEADGSEEGSESRPFFAITEADLAEQGEGQPSTQTAPETEMKSAEAVEGAEENKTSHPFQRWLVHQPPSP